MTTRVTIRLPDGNTYTLPLQGTACDIVPNTVTFDPPVTFLKDDKLEISYECSREEPMPNEANRRNLKAQMDCLSDAHAELTKKAATISARLLDADTRDRDNPGKGATSRKFADRQLEYLLEDLEAQHKRILRVAAEIEQIKKNLRVI